MTNSPTSEQTFTDNTVSANRDERKSARLAAERVKAEDGAERIRNFAFARTILRSDKMKQAGAGADLVNTGNPEHVSVFFLDGDLHRRRRSAIAKYFAPKTVNTRYRELMERKTDELLGRLKQQGEAELDKISFDLAVAVAAEIVGLTNTNQVHMATRIRSMLVQRKPVFPWLAKLLGRKEEFGTIMSPLRALIFFFRDVRPAIKAHRKQRKEDVISHLLDEGYSDKAIFIECMTYATAGMVTTREFIVMAAWHLFEREQLRERFLTGGAEDQLAILEEILRLEPVAAMLHRRTTEETADVQNGTIPADKLYAIDIRAANVDEAATGPCPYSLDPDRAKKTKVGGGAFMSFGDGAHRCPGSQVALQETRIFLDRLFRLPGIRLKTQPELGWCDPIMGYEVRNAIVACDPG